MILSILIFQQVPMSETQVFYSKLHIAQLYLFCLISLAATSIQKSKRILDTIARTPKWLALCMYVGSNWKTMNFW